MMRKNFTNFAEAGPRWRWGAPTKKKPTFEVGYYLLWR